MQGVSPRELSCRSPPHEYCGAAVRGMEGGLLGILDGGEGIHASRFTLPAFSPPGTPKWVALRTGTGTGAASGASRRVGWGGDGGWKFQGPVERRRMESLGWCLSLALVLATVAATAAHDEEDKRSARIRFGTTLPSSLPDLLRLVKPLTDVEPGEKRLCVQGREGRTATWPCTKKPSSAVPSSASVSLRPSLLPP